MRDRSLRSVLVVMAVFAVAPPMLAQTSPPSGAVNAARDLSGFWAQARVEGRTQDPLSRRFSEEQPPLQPWAMELFRANRGPAGLANPNLNGSDELDPRNNCFPAGVPRLMLFGPFQIVQIPDQVLILHEQDNAVRRIYMDGRGHTEGFPPSWKGHSIGRWDGDTLVVDTVALTDRKWLDRIGTPHSEELHVVERYRRVNHETLEVTLTFEDPKAFTRPWGGKKLFTLRPNFEMLEDLVCDERYVMEKKPGVRPRFEAE